MALQNLSSGAALASVREKRPKIQPNPGFMEQLALRNADGYDDDDVGNGDGGNAVAAAVAGDDGAAAVGAGDTGGDGATGGVEATAPAGMRDIEYEVLPLLVT
jgi:hypothetical protein